MANVTLPLVQDVPENLDFKLLQFLKSVKETLEILTGQVGANTKLIDYMELTGKLYGGVGSPEGVLAARVGCLYLREDGSTGTTLYVKESGSGNIGWIAK